MINSELKKPNLINTYHIKWLQSTLQLKLLKINVNIVLKCLDYVDNSP